MKIEVLGPGCKTCEMLYDNVIKAIEKAGLQGGVQVEKVKDMDYWMRLGVFTTPGLVMDGQVVSVGRLLSPEEILEKLRERRRA